MQKTTGKPVASSIRSPVVPDDWGAALPVGAVLYARDPVVRLEGY